ncbi:SigE family RNA polymerase sigma factor [Nocardioides sp. SR21]|uniref:SigE family RNA polymerase sigma factor n=1 Tax=Nocardioides sp. SR21 TaxID=2919501 RepID=UPI001FA98E1D|nr:SigE family RNA polymerase sigma factor [Nocardioides sp. SR21]
MRRRSREDAFTAWAGDAQHQLHRKAYLLTGEQESARDLVQQVLLSTYLAWHRVDHPTAYATTSLVRAFFKVAEQRRRELPSDVLVEIPAPHPALDDRLTLLDALAELPPRMRATLMLRFWDDLSVRDTAHVLGCSEGTVKSATSKALAHLRDRLGEAVTTAPGELR